MSHTYANGAIIADRSMNTSPQSSAVFSHGLKP